MNNQKLLATIIGVSLTVILAPASANDMNHYRTENIHKDHRLKQPIIMRNDYRGRQYRNPRYGYRERFNFPGRHFDSGRAPRRHYHYSGGGRGYDGDLLIFRRGYNDSYHGRGFGSWVRNDYAHDRHCRYR